MTLAASELILNEDGSVYHLGIKPEHLADTVITVGDPERVKTVAAHFDSIQFECARREFHTVTGLLGSKRITVISTGIGTDNVDIVLNELDALVNINLKTRTILPSSHSLQIIRIGTTGGLHEDIDPGTILLSEHSVGLDGMMLFYPQPESQSSLQLALEAHFAGFPLRPTFFEAGESLLAKFPSETLRGITATCTGFYGPQGRSLRLRPTVGNLAQRLAEFNHRGKRITNFEMETSGLYGLSSLLGHQCVSVNVVLANRATGQFSESPAKEVEKTIRYTLEVICA